MNPLLAAALGYISRGWPVLPCEPDGKRPLGVCVPHGLQNATLNPEHARAWWRRYPNANVAIPTGAVTVDTVDVFDVDVAPDGSGYAAVNRLKAAGLLPQPLAVVRTPRGGMHVYYRGSDQRCGRLKAHHLDFKATGGYVLVPPSVVDGRQYELVGEYAGRSVLNWGAVREFLDPPKPIPTATRPKASGTGIPGLAAWLAGQTEGNRNSGLYWAACRAVENGATDLEELVSVAVSIGLTEREARRTARSALRTRRSA